MPSSQQMQVKVIDGLSAIGTGVEDEAKSVVEVVELCDVVCSEEESAVDILFGR